MAVASLPHLEAREPPKNSRDEWQSSAALGLLLSTAVSSVNHRFFKTHSYGSLLSALIAGTSLAYPVWKNQADQPTRRRNPNFNPVNAHNLFGGAILLAQAIFFCQLKTLPFVGSNLYLGGRFAFAGPFFLGFCSEFFNQCVVGINGKKKPVEEIDLLTISMMSLVSCYYGLAAKWVSGWKYFREYPLQFGTTDFRLFSMKSLWRTFSFNAIVTGWAAPFQYLWAYANTGDHQESFEIVRDVTLLNLTAGTFNERFIYRNFGSPAAPLAITSRQMLIFGEFAGYLKWVKES